MDLIGPSPSEKSYAGDLNNMSFSRIMTDKYILKGKKIIDKCQVEKILIFPS